MHRIVCVIASPDRFRVFASEEVDTACVARSLRGRVYMNDGTEYRQCGTRNAVIGLPLDSTSYTVRGSLNNDRREALEACSVFAQEV